MGSFAEIDRAVNPDLPDSPSPYSDADRIAVLDHPFAPWDLEPPEDDTDFDSPGPTPLHALTAPLPGLDELLDDAERAGWQGDPLVVPACLEASDAALVALAWAEGRRQRDQDERAVSEALEGRWLEQGRRAAEMMEGQSWAR